MTQMKKNYMRPLMEVIEIKATGMLCVSTGLGDGASDAALAREDDDEWID